MATVALEMTALACSVAAVAFKMAAQACSVATVALKKATRACSVTTVTVALQIEVEAMFKDAIQRICAL